MEQTPLVTYGHSSHRGLQRADNQDSYGKFPREHLDLTDPAGLLFIVADGMGGHRGGREASQMAVHHIAEQYYAASSKVPPDKLRRAFEHANAVIYRRAVEDPELYGMGTTTTALLLRGTYRWIAHVGDSRAYRITPEGIEQFTQDHSQVEEMVRRNILTPEEAASHPHRNVLSRALGARADVEVDVSERGVLQAGDCYLLCSDGLARVPEADIHDAVLAHPPQQACDLLVRLANDHGGHDNVTVLVVCVHRLPGRGRRLLHSLKRMGRS